MNTIQKYLNEYLIVHKANEDGGHEQLFEKYQTLLDTSIENLQKCFKFLPKNQVLSFHDSTIKGNVRPNMSGDSFYLTIRLLCFQKIDEPSMKYPYEEIDPVHVKFKLNNQFRTVFHKLAVKSSVLIDVQYDEGNLGVMYFDKDWELKCFYQEGIDLSNNQVVIPSNSQNIK